MNRIALVLIFLLSPFLFCYAQFEHLRNGDFLFEKGYYNDAAEAYLNFLEDRPNDVSGNLRLAKCYLLMSDEKSAEKPLFIAFEFSKRRTFEMYYLRGQYYHFNHEFTKAIKDYEKSGAKGKLQPRVCKKIRECKQGQYLDKKSVEVIVSSLGDEVNSKFNDMLPQVVADESKMFFSSSRQGIESVYSSVKTEEGWKEPEMIFGDKKGERSNTCVGISPDGLMMYLYSGENGGDLFVVKNKKGEWSRPVPFPFNTDAKESSVTISPDGKHLLFVRKRQGRTGVLYSSFLSQDSVWSEPKVFELNTAYDEVTPYFHPDGKTLFFSSNGEGTIGGLDVFYSQKTEEGWGAPKNLGRSLNTAKDEFGYLFSARGKKAFFSSNRIKGKGEQDIYKVEYEEDLFPSNLCVLSGRVLDEQGLPLEATVVLVDLHAQEAFVETSSNFNTGKFQWPLESGKEYGVRVEREGYVFSSKNVSIPINSGYLENVYEVVLSKVEAKSIIVLGNVFFDVGESSLDFKSRNELFRLGQFLKDNDKIEIEVSGHTDNQGSEESNQLLSEKRAESVKQFLNSQGVESRRIFIKGYGSTKPLMSNDNEQGRAKNRRIEVLILE